MASPSSWFREFASVGAFLGMLWLLGASSGYPGLFLAGGLLVYFFWHLFNLYRLANWLDRKQKKLPGFTPGIWGHIYYRLEASKRKTSRRKKQVRRLLKAFNTSSRALPDATVTLDRDFRIQWMNDAAISLLGMRKTDAGQPVINLVRNPDFNAYLDKGKFSEPLATGPTRHGSILIDAAVLVWPSIGTGNRNTDYLLLTAHPCVRECGPFSTNTQVGRSGLDVCS